MSDFQMVTASGPIASTRASRRYGPGLRQTHLLRPCEVRVLRRQHADRDFLRPAATSAAASARCHAEAGLRRRRRARRRPGRAARAAATSRRRTGAPMPMSAITRGCRSTRHDRQATEPPSAAKGVLERRGPPGHTDPSAPTPSRVRQTARLMSITRPPRGRPTEHVAFRP